MISVVHRLFFSFQTKSTPILIGRNCLRRQCFAVLYGPTDWCPKIQGAELFWQTGEQILQQWAQTTDSSEGSDCTREDRREDIRESDLFQKQIQSKKEQFTRRYDHRLIFQIPISI